MSIQSRMSKQSVVYSGIIGEYAFENTKVLYHLGELPALTTIGDHAFDTSGFEYELNEPKLKKLGDLPELTTIGKYAFRKCYSLWGLGNMKKLTSIGEGAFDDSRDLNIVHLPKSLKSVKINAFRNCRLSKIIVEPGAAFQCSCYFLAKKLAKNEKIRVTGDRFEFYDENEYTLTYDSDHDSDYEEDYDPLLQDASAWYI